MTDVEKVETALGDPAIDDLSEFAHKLRRNLLVSSSFAFVYVFGQIRIEKTTPLGIQLSGLSDGLVAVILLMLLLYHLTHFMWCCADYIGIWRIHITGTRLGFKSVAVLGSEDCDYPDDKQQSNLYRWWLDRAKRIEDMSDLANTLQETADQLRNAAERYEPLRGGLENQFVSRARADIVEHLSQLNRKIESFHQFSSSHRFPVSLSRFDQWFRMFKLSQLLRLFVFEIGLPCALGLLALASVIVRLVSSGC